MQETIITQVLAETDERIEKELRRCAEIVAASSSPFPPREYSFIDFQNALIRKYELLAEKEDLANFKLSLEKKGEK